MIVEALSKHFKSMGYYVGTLRTPGMISGKLISSITVWKDDAAHSRHVISIRNGEVTLYFSQHRHDL
jgi:hypothetical protein